MGIGMQLLMVPLKPDKNKGQPSFRQRLESASVLGIAGSFWTLAVLVQIKLQGGVVEPIVLGAMLLGCLLLLGLVGLRQGPDLGTPGLLLLAAIASYLGISAVVSLANDFELLTRDVARQGFFLLVTLAALLGGRWMLERIGVEPLLRGLLVALAAGCAVILASPLLWEIGIAAEYRLPYRLTGFFTDPNDASFIACITVALALAFQANGRQGPLGYLALFLGCAAGIASFSDTGIIVLGVLLILFLARNRRRRRQYLWHTGLTALFLVGVLVWLSVIFQGIGLFGQSETLPPATPTLINGEAGIIDVKQVGSPVRAHLVNDKEHRADDDPIQRWRWQRADARLYEVDTPEARPVEVIAPDADTWTRIEGAGSFSYTPVAADLGKFLRASVSYEKHGLIYRVQTATVGPIGPAPETNLVELAVELVEEAGDNIREDSEALPRRLLLWELGFNRALASPIVGNGLYQLHFMPGAPIAHQGAPTGVHNVYLMLIGEAGIIPLVLYLLSLFLLARALWTAPKSLGRDLVMGWVIVLAMFGLMFHHLLTMGAYNFVIGLTCAMAAYLVQGQGQIDPNGGAAAGGAGGANGANDEVGGSSRDNE